MYCKVEEIKHKCSKIILSILLFMLNRSLDDMWFFFLFSEL